MKTLTRAIVGSLAAVSSVAYAADPPINTPAAAFQAGKNFGQSGKGIAAGKVNSATGSQELPNFTTTAPQSASFANGNGNVQAAGNAKLVACQNSVAPNALAQQECDAVNFLAQNPSVRPHFTIDKVHDPLMTGSAATVKNPAPQGITGSVGSQQCHVVTTNVPATFTTKSCEKTTAIDTINCNKTLNASVNVHDTCTPNTWFTEADAYKDSFDIMQVQPYCDVTRTDGTQVFQVYAHGQQGACSGWQQVTLNMNSTSTVPSAIASLSPHWGGSCKSLTAYAQVNGCSASGSCSVQFYFSTSYPFVPTYSACPSGQTAGSDITFQTCTGTGDDMQCTTSTGSATSCYAPDTNTPPGPGAVQATNGYWTYAGSKQVVGFTIDQSAQVWSTSLSFVKPKETVVVSESWNDQCSPYAAATQQH